MMTALVFRLWAPMAAWGDIAVGERRGSWSRPGKTAILGLVAAALGYRRAEEAGHRALHDGLGYAVRVETTGRPMRDYHTAQAPGARHNRRWATRREELADRSTLNTILSERSYYTEPSMTVALWLRGEGGAAPPLTSIAEALRAPRFVLYLGRKACPPGSPLYPCIIDAEDLGSLFASYREQRPRMPGGIDAPRAADVETWTDLDPALGLSHPEIVTRRDGLRNRKMWLFADRREGRLADASMPPP